MNPDFAGIRKNLRVSDDHASLAGRNSVEYSIFVPQQAGSFQAHR